MPNGSNQRLRFMIAVLSLCGALGIPSFARADENGKRWVWIYLKNPQVQEDLVKKLDEELQWEGISLKVFEGEVPPDHALGKSPQSPYAVVWLTAGVLNVNNPATRTHLEKDISGENPSNEVLSTYIRRLVLMSGKTAPSGDVQHLPVLEKNGAGHPPFVTKEYGVNIFAGPSMFGWKEADIGGKATIEFSHITGVVAQFQLAFYSRLSDRLDLLQAPVSVGAGYALSTGVHAFEFLAGFSVVSLMAQANTSPSRIDTRAVAQVWADIGWMVALDSERSWLFRLSLGMLWYPIPQVYVYKGETIGRVETLAPCSTVQIGYNLL